MIAKEIMSKIKVSLTPDDTVQNFISLIEKYHIHEVLVLENKKLVGVVNYKMLASKNIADPSKTKVRNIMIPCPKTLSPEDDLEKIADLIFKTGAKALPIVDKNVVLGIVSSHDVINAAAKNKIFENTTVDKIMIEPIVIKDDTEIGKARAIMREKGISRLPVVDENNKIKGIVTVFDLLKALKPRERMSWYSMAAEMDNIMRIPVSTIMNVSPITAEANYTLTDIASLMSKNGTSGIIITEDNVPKGVVTIKDLLEVLVSQQKQKGVYCQIIGLTDEDEFVVDAIYKMIEDTAQKLSHMYNPDFIFLHVKKYETGLKARIKYSIRARIKTKIKGVQGMFMSKAWGWDLRDAVGEALDNLEKAVIKERETKRERIRSDLIKMKRNR